MKNQEGKEVRDLTLDEVLRLVKDTMSSACERDIYTGDFVDIAVITKDGVAWEKFELKRD
jgi:20S proteasome subunit beta 6